jgi:uncharacterized membrane protein YgdD (TMEM256/DUF423 family)
MQRLLFFLGAIAGGTAVAMASAASHKFDALPAGDLVMIRAALQMHGWHALALLGCALWLPRGGRWTEAAGVCFAAGLIVFCGAVYGLALGWWHVPLAAPVGGSLLILGWVLLAVSAFSSSGRG